MLLLGEGVGVGVFVPLDKSSYLLISINWQFIVEGYPILLHELPWSWSACEGMPIFGKLLIIIFIYLSCWRKWLHISIVIISAPSIPQKFVMDNQHPDKGLRMKWDSPQCDRQSGYPAKYRIKYCKGGRNDSCQSEFYFCHIHWVIQTDC